MKAVIEVDVPKYQIGQEVSVYFKDTMCVKSVCKKKQTRKKKTSSGDSNAKESRCNNSIVEELEEIKKELQEHINVFGTEFGCELTQVQQMNNCAVQRDIDVINEHISKLKGE